MKRLTLALAAPLAAAALAASASASPPTDRHAAQSGERAALTRPDIERWVFLGATVDHGVVPDDGTRKFGADDPGFILVTQMEPGAFEYFRKHKRYADGTTFATSFYKPHENPRPAMDGVVQGELAVLFVHRLQRDGEGWRHAFHVFMNGKDTAKRMPDGNECVACHTKNGDLDGTYVQFYPVLRDLLREAPAATGAEAPGRAAG